MHNHMIAHMPINLLERTSLIALIEYKAAETSLSCNQIKDCFTATFAVQKIDDIKNEQYDAAIRWLVDCSPSMIN